MSDVTAASSVATSKAVAGGMAAGLIAGLFGVGGGVVLVPLLVLWLRQPQHIAHATSLVAVTLAAASAVVRFGIDGSVAVAGAIALAVGSIVGAQVGAALLPKLTDTHLRRAFAALMLLIAVRFLVAGGGGDGTVADATSLDVLRLGLHVLGGLVAGIVSSVFGVGGGVVFVPLLVIAFGYGQHVAEGTSLAVIVPTAATGALAHHRNSYTDWRLGLTVGAGAVVGAIVGASFALGLSPDLLGRLFGGLLVVTGAMMLRTPTED